MKVPRWGCWCVLKSITAHCRPNTPPVTSYGHQIIKGFLCHYERQLKPKYLYHQIITIHLEEDNNFYSKFQFLRIFLKIQNVLVATKEKSEDHQRQSMQKNKTKQICIKCWTNPSVVDIIQQISEHFDLMVKISKVIRIYYLATMDTRAKLNGYPPK